MSAVLKSYRIKEAAERLSKVAIPVPQSPAVYFLLHDGVVVYIGQSISPIGRIADHVRDKVFDSYVVIPVEREKLLHEEARAIRKFKPKYNGTTEGRSNKKSIPFEQLRIAAERVKPVSEKDIPVGADR